MKSMIELYGCGVSNGIAIGKLSYYRNNDSNIPEYEVVDTNAELLRYRNGMKLAKKYLQKLYEAACERVSKSESVIFQTHIMILEDSKFVETVENCITKKKKNAEFAVHTAATTFANIFKKLDDEYLKSRYCDIIDAANTLLEILQNRKTENQKNSEPVIIAADDLLPSETISFKKESLLGFVTNHGSKNSHSAILARTMGVPSVAQIEKPLAQYNGMTTIIDGHLGKIIINPDRNTIALYHAKKERYNKQQKLLKQQIGLESVTKNGQHITLSANIGLLEDIETAKDNDAENIGLFRSEFLFLRRNSYPNEDEQFEAYKTIIKAIKNQRAVIRTADINVDSGINYLDIPKEKNPAMGFRGIRISLSNNEFFKTQLRALYRASVYGRLCILLPMVDSIEEIEFVKRIIDKVKAELKAKGQSFSENVELGVMIETPAAAIISDEICKAVDFVSIGTNDLTQYTLAIDRSNQKLEYFYRPYHPAILKLIRFIAENAHKNGKRVSICGELASDTAMTETFLAMNIDELSMVPSKILKVKAKVRETDTTDCSDILAKI